MLSLPTMSLATATISSVTVSTANPAPGSVLGVTVVYCENAANNNTFFDVALEPSSSTTIQSCPIPGQHFLIDENSTPAGPTAILTSNRDDPTDGGDGWSAGNSSGTISCPATQIFNVTIPVTMTVGSYNIVTATQTDDIQCSNAGSISASGQGSAAININFSSASPSLIISENSIGDSAQASNLVLFQINYTAINTNPITITGTVPNNTALASGTSSAVISPGGTLTSGTGGAGSTIQWVINNTNTAPQGYVWFLTSVNSSFTAGTITNSATVASASFGNMTTNTVSVQVGGDFQLIKSILSNTSNLATGSIVTYSLQYTIGQSSLQVYDTYNNDAAPTTTTNGSNVTGFDGTAYSTGTNPNANNDNWEIQSNSTVPVGAPGGGNYIDADTPFTASSTAYYVALLRNTPLNLCAGGSVIIQGDVDMPSTLQNGAANGPGEDATLALLNLPSGQGLNAILSINNFPGNLELQESDSGASYPDVAIVSSPNFQSAAMNTSPSDLFFNTWYTIKALLSYNSATATWTISVKAWPVGTAEPAGWDINNYTTSTLPCSANYKYGWVENPTSNSPGNYSPGRQLYADLSVFASNPLVNPSISDTLPTGETYVAGSANQAPNLTTPFLEWNIGGAEPVTVYNLNGALTWAASVTCVPAAQVNQAEISGTVGGAPQTLLSNSVSLNVSMCFTATPTLSPTVTATPTQTPTPIPDIDIFYVAQNVYNATNDNPVSIFVQYTKFPGNYSLLIYNSAGEHVRTLDSQTLSAPISQSYFWDGKNKYGANCASGVYILYLTEPFSQKMKRLLLIR
jgi:hypothetical protein